VPKKNGSTTQGGPPRWVGGAPGKRQENDPPLSSYWGGKKHPAGGKKIAKLGNGGGGKKPLKEDRGRDKTGRANDNYHPRHVTAKHARKPSKNKKNPHWKPSPKSRTKGEEKNRDWDSRGQGKHGERGKEVSKMRFEQRHRKRKRKRPIGTLRQVVFQG